MGRNGSGKTMLFRALSGPMNIDSGRVWLNQKLLHRDFGVLPGLGILLENAGLYPKFTGKRKLQFLADVKKVVSEEMIEDVILRVGLNPNDRRIVGRYSLGMKQRIVLAQAILDQCPLVLKVKSAGERTYLFQDILQNTEVEWVFRDEGFGMAVGDLISIYGGHGINFSEKELNMGYINFMQSGHSYLVFLEKECDASRYISNRTFRLSGFNPNAYVDYAQDSSTVISAGKARYGDYRENQWFSVDEGVLEHMVSWENQLLEKYTVPDIH